MSRTRYAPIEPGENPLDDPVIRKPAPAGSIALVGALFALFALGGLAALVYGLAKPPAEAEPPRPTTQSDDDHTPGIRTLSGAMVAPTETSKPENFFDEGPTQTPILVTVIQTEIVYQEQRIEVTKEIIREVIREVEVPVTRISPVYVTVQVPVTQLVIVTATPTSTPTPTATSSPTATNTPESPTVVISSPTASPTAETPTATATASQEPTP